MQNLYDAYFLRFRRLATWLISMLILLLTWMCIWWRAPASPEGWAGLLLLGPLGALLGFLRPQWKTLAIWVSLSASYLAAYLYRGSLGSVDLTLAMFPVFCLYREIGSLAGALLGLGLERLFQGELEHPHPPEFFWWLTLYSGLALISAIHTQKEVQQVSHDEARLGEQHEKRNAQHLQVQRKRHEVLQSVLERVTELCQQVVFSTHSLSALGQRQSADHNLSQAVAGIAESSKLIRTTCKTLAESMSELAAQAGETHHIVTGSEQLLVSAQDQVARIRAAAQVVLERLELLLHRTERVSALVGSIHKISDRVALLALHAAMEAERASDSHEDFRYVAEEIRRLADRTEVATLEVARILTEMHQEVKINLESMQQFSHEVIQCEELLAELLGKMQDSTERVGTVDRRFSQVSVLLGGQARALEEIKKAVEQLSHMQEQSARALLDTNEVMGTLEETTQNLNWAVSGLR